MAQLSDIHNYEFWVVFQLWIKIFATSNVSPTVSQWNSIYFIDCLVQYLSYIHSTIVGCYITEIFKHIATTSCPTDDTNEKKNH